MLRVRHVPGPRRPHHGAAWKCLALALPLGAAALAASPEIGGATQEPGASPSQFTAAKAPGAADVSSLAAYARVDVAPTSTSIYIGTVAMTMPTFARVEGRYETTYAAKVFPYFFSNENGRLTVDLSDAALRQLERGEPVTFTGHAVNTAGAERRVEGKATPADARSGKLKVRVFVSSKIELIFNTTYRFPDAK